MTEKDIRIIGENSSIRKVYLGASKGVTKEQARSAFSPGVALRFGNAFDKPYLHFDFDYPNVVNGNNDDFFARA